MAVAGFLSAATELCAQTVVYVDPDATGPLHDGSTWCQAYTDLQTTLTEATVGTEIRVAAGTHKPTAGTSRLATFRPRTGVALYGAFAGCGEPNPDIRDPVAYETVLSGDLFDNDDLVPASSCCRDHGAIGCDDVSCESAVCSERPSCCSTIWDRSCAALAAMLCCQTCGNKCDNSYHVVSVDNYPSTDETAVLDGFTITGGFADGSNPKDRGAGLFIYFFESSPTISNCIIRGNIATAKAAGVYNDITTATFTNCVFTGNIAPTGAAMYNIRSSPTLMNCTLSGNTAIANAGGIWNILDDDDVPRLMNCLLWGNADDGGPDESGQMNPGNGNVMVDYSIIQGWSGLFGGTGNSGDDPLLVDALGPDDVAGTPDDDLRLGEGSPAINTSDPGFVPDPDGIDVAGLPRLQGCRVDRGAFESDAAQRFGDFDADDFVTLADFAFLQRCFAPAVSDPDWPHTCLCVFDDDGNEDIDLDDYAAFHAAFHTP